MSNALGLGRGGQSKPQVVEVLLQITHRGGHSQPDVHASPSHSCGRRRTRDTKFFIYGVVVLIILWREWCPLLASGLCRSTSFQPGGISSKGQQPLSQRSVKLIHPQDAKCSTSNVLCPTNALTVRLRCLWRPLRITDSQGKEGERLRVWQTQTWSISQSLKSWRSGCGEHSRGGHAHYHRQEPGGGLLLTFRTPKATCCPLWLPPKPPSSNHDSSQLPTPDAQPYP